MESIGLIALTLIRSRAKGTQPVGMAILGLKKVPYAITLQSFCYAFSPQRVSESSMSGVAG